VRVPEAEPAIGRVEFCRCLDGPVHFLVITSIAVVVCGFQGTIGRLPFNSGLQSIRSLVIALAVGWTIPGRPLSFTVSSTGS